jgi:CTP:molybdopterin cytidylyltransferase MocA
VLEALGASRVDEVVVVSGAYDIDVAGVSGSEPQASIRVVHCAEWARGPGSSLRCGFVALSHKVDAAVVVLADGPGLDPRAVDRVVDAWRGGSGDRLAATYDGENRSHPVLLARAVWNKVPDEGARALDVALVHCRDLTPPGDVDHV